MEGMPDEFELPPDLIGKIPLFSEIAKVLSWTGGPVNWDLARQVAVALAAGEEQAHEVADDDDAEITEAVRLAELWLTEDSGLPVAPRIATVRVSTPAGWAERATSSFQELVDPLAGKVVAAVGQQSAALAEGADEAMLGPVLRQMAPVFLGIQTGVVVGTLALGILGSYDIPLPAAEEGSIDILLPQTDALADAFGLERDEVRLWVALHQTAHRLEFEALPWVSTHFFALYHNYVAALEVDLGGAFERLQSMDVASPERLRQAMEEEGFFGLLESPRTAGALARIQTLMAVLEAFADRAVAAAGARLPAASRIAEAMARRSAEPGPGDRLFRRFIGLDLRPEQLRGAEAFCRRILDTSGWPALGRLWEHPENLPTDAELADPPAWLARMGG